MALKVQVAEGLCLQTTVLLFLSAFPCVRTTSPGKIAILHSDELLTLILYKFCSDLIYGEVVPVVDWCDSETSRVTKQRSFEFRREAIN